MLGLSIEPVVISQPPIEADTNLAKPSESKDEEAFVTSEGAPFIRAGRNNWSTLKSPLTTKLEPSY